MNTKKIFFIIVIILMIMILVSIIFKKVIKNDKNGNTINSQKIVDTILNLNSYKSNVLVQVNSNKSRNKYILNQEYNTENGSLQEVIEPENIAGIKIIKKDNKLSIENSGLDLKTIFENYQGLEDNSLDLINFIQDYKKSEKSNYEEKENEIIMITNSNDNKYITTKKLYINKENSKPIKLEIQDNNQNITTLIEYNEIELN